MSSDPIDLILSSFFGYSGGYRFEDTVEVGKGYWVKTQSSGKIYLTSGVAAASREVARDIGLSRLNTLRLTDKSGSSQTLYFGTSRGPIHAADSELPPVPPVGIFDVRFSSQRMVEICGQDESKEFPVDFHSASYPVTVRWDVREGDLWTLRSTGLIQTISGSGTLMIASEADNQLTLKRENAGASLSPKEFALLQNYPNPFNPLTLIRYQLPVQSKVTLKVYDLLGREVSTLVDEVQGPGFRSVPFSANVSGGIYVYRLQARPADGAQVSSFSDIKKMIYIR